MAIPVPHQFVVNEFPTAANLNSGAYTGVNWLLGGGSGLKPSFRAHLAAVISIPNSANTIVKFDTVDEDTDGAYAVGTGVWTCVTAGLYLFTTNFSYASNGTGTRTTVMISTGAPTSASAPPISAAVDALGRANLSLLGRFTVGQTMNVTANQSSGGALNSGSGTATSFGGVMVSI